jgi:hypothetical protein
MMNPLKALVLYIASTLPASAELTALVAAVEAEPAAPAVAAPAVQDDMGGA